MWKRPLENTRNSLANKELSINTVYINVKKPPFVSIEVRSLSEQETIGVSHVYLVHSRVINIIAAIDGNGRPAKVKS